MAANPIIKNTFVDLTAERMREMIPGQYPKGDLLLWSCMVVAEKYRLVLLIEDNLRNVIDQYKTILIIRNE